MIVKCVPQFHLNNRRDLLLSSLFKIVACTKKTACLQLATNLHLFCWRTRLSLRMMKTVVTVVVTLLFSLLPLGHNVRAQEDSTEIVLFDYEILTSSPIPVPLSDFTAVLDPIKNQTYLAGGCNSPEGNRFNTTSGNFNCASLSDKMYVFNMDQRSFEEVAFSMPVARYRHAAAWTNNQVWLVGGRALNDDLITEVDVSYIILVF